MDGPPDDPEQPVDSVTTPPVSEQPVESGEEPTDVDVDDEGTSSPGGELDPQGDVTQPSQTQEAQDHEDALFQGSPIAPPEAENPSPPPLTTTPPEATPVLSPTPAVAVGVGVGVGVGAPQPQEKARPVSPTGSVTSTGSAGGLSDTSTGAVDWQMRWNKLEAHLSGEVLDVVISQPTKKGDYYHERHVTYLITTRPRNHIVRRRYSDFEWLRNVLLTRFPGLLLPSLPPKELQGSTFKSKAVDPSKSEFIMMRQQLLRYFLTDLVRIPFVRSDPSLDVFLSCQDDKNFAEQKEQTAKLTPEQNVSEGVVLWFNTLLDAPRSKTWDRVSLDFRRQLDEMEAEMKSVKRALDSFIDALEANSRAAKRFSGAITSLVNKERSFGDTTTFEYANKSAPIAMTVTSAAAAAFDHLSQVSEAQPVAIDLVLRAGVKYLVNQINAFREYIRLRDEQAAEVNRLIKKVDGLLESQRNGKETAKLSFFSSVKKPLDEIIAEEREQLEYKQKVLTVMTAALEYSEVDRFNYQRTQFLREIMAAFALCEHDVISAQQDIWSRCMDRLHVPADHSRVRVDEWAPMLKTFARPDEAHHAHDEASASSPHPLFHHSHSNSSGGGSNVGSPAHGTASVANSTTSVGRHSQSVIDAESHIFGDPGFSASEGV